MTFKVQDLTKTNLKEDGTLPVGIQLKQKEPLLAGSRFHHSDFIKFCCMLKF